MFDGFELISIVYIQAFCFENFEKKLISMEAIDNLLKVSYYGG